MNRDEWERPYVPPEGLVPECLMPDGCTEWDAPVMGRPLEPLSRFDQPQLKRGPVHCDWDALFELRLFMAKQCAGLAYAYRPDIPDLREAFRMGRFTDQQSIALAWAFSGMRAKYTFPGLIAGAQLPIFEVARCFWTLFEGSAFGCGPWLNQWADNPDRPHPATLTDAWGENRIEYAMRY